MTLIDDYQIRRVYDEERKTFLVPTLRVGMHMG
ncbi:hypothetical protein MNBD_GAMMA26-2645 [hydrothermal vent metagenome]|uniref:Uncharacterized protein n=1 Tax=hydrothermal vent metagenome TaxID=652676 RepID=A0A3B1B7K2_9ZZZZ